MSDDGSNEAEAKKPDRASQVLETFLGEPMLWPVAIVVYLSLCSFGALCLLYALRMRGILAGLLLLILIFVTVYHLDPDIRARKLRPSSALLVAIWVGSAAVGVILNAMGAFQTS